MHLRVTLLTAVCFGSAHSCIISSVTVQSRWVCHSFYDSLYLCSPWTKNWRCFHLKVSEIRLKVLRLCCCSEWQRLPVLWNRFLSLERSIFVCPTVEGNYVEGGFFCGKRSRTTEPGGLNGNYGLSVFSLSWVSCLPVRRVFWRNGNPQFLGLVLFRPLYRSKVWTGLMKIFIAVVLSFWL